MAKSEAFKGARAALIKGRTSRSRNLVRAFDDVPYIVPEVIREWLQQEGNNANEACKCINHGIEQLLTESELDRLAAASIRMNAADFCDLAKRALKLVLDEADQPPAIAEAFTLGLRLGMVHENLASLADGRWSEKWLRQESRVRAAETTNAAHKELHAEYQPAVEKQMRDTGCSYTTALEQVAKSFGVSDSTVKSHTTNPTPRNRGGQRRKGS